MKMNGTYRWIARDDAHHDGGDLLRGVHVATLWVRQIMADARRNDLNTLKEKQQKVQ